ncbi:Hpt domain-containing protein [Vibrio agarivorans]
MLSLFFWFTVKLSAVNILGKRMKFHRGYIALVIWIIATITGVIWLRGEYAVLSALEELDNEIQETRTLVSIEPVFQTNHLEHLALSTHLINSLKLELLASQRDAMFSHDVNQLIMLIDRFTRLTEQLSDNQVQVVDLLDTLSVQMEQYKTDSEIHALLTELGSLTFIAMFGDQSSNAYVYRDLDRLYTQSLTLAEEDKRTFQQLLALSSDTLGAYAQGAYLIEQLVSFEVSRYITDLRQELFQHIRSAGVVFAAVNLIPVLLLLFSWSSRQGKRKEPIPVLAKEMTTNEAMSDIEPQEDSPSEASIELDDPTGTPISCVDYDYMLDSVSGDKESVALLLGVFVDDHQNDAEKIERLIAEQNPEAMRAAHSLKGVAASVGAMPLREIATVIEANIKQGRVTSAKELEQLALHLSQTIESAKKYTDCVNA